MGASRGTGNGMARIHSKDIVNHHHHPALLRYTFGMPSGRTTTEVGRLASPTVSGSEGNVSVTVGQAATSPIHLFRQVLCLRIRFR